jgi:hypothetical protein
MQRLLELLLELRGVRPVEVSIQHEHLRLAAGWLGAEAALLGHRFVPSVALSFGTRRAMKRLT